MTVTLDDLAKMPGVSVIAPTAMNKRKISRLLTDSRSLTDAEETLFFAISTSTNTGLKYVEELYDKGVRMFVVTDIPKDMQGKDDVAFIVHENPVELLQRICTRRPGIGGEIVAITGSTGKTTLKEWLFQLLEPMREIARSPRSYNSQIGVPLSMWEITPATDLTIIEAGISTTGEMEKLRKCISPDVVIITVINDRHSSGFTSLREKAREKVSLARDAQKVIYNSDDEELERAINELPQSTKRISWSAGTHKKADLLLFPESRENRLNYHWQGREYEIQLAEDINRNFRSILGPALAFMLSEGYDPTTIARRFSSIHSITTRLSVSEGGDGCNIVFDSYTSDYNSLLPAIDFIMRRRMPNQIPMVILSDLRHEAYRDKGDYKLIASLMKAKGISRFIGVGHNFMSHSDLFGEGSLFFADTQSLASWLRKNPPENSIVLIKGAPEFDFPIIRRALEMRTHQTVLEINLDAIIRNYNYFKSHLPSSCGMIAMVKASGYGAGSYEIAKTLQDAGAAYLAVAVLDEGIDLRSQGIRMPVMVMNPRVEDYEEMFFHRLEPEIYSPAMLEDVIQSAATVGIADYPIHIKLDTGMHRMGFVEEELPVLMDRIEAQKNVRISSVFSHLATADEPSMDDYTEMQLRKFREATDYMLHRSRSPFKRHILNSAGILRFGKSYHFDMARLGIGLYGVNTLPPEIEEPLSVVSTLRTVIINIRQWPAGTTIGYGRRGRLDRDATIATIPIGYADGMNRLFGNGKINVMVNGLPAPTVGNICMDACMIDVSGIECGVGDNVEIFGEGMSVQRLADAIPTIPYEILTSISPRVKRTYFRE